MDVLAPRPHPPRDPDGPGEHDHHLPPPPPPPVAAVAARSPLSHPVAVGALALGACALLVVRDPNEGGSYGLCPFKAVAGLDCPGCGLTRGTAALLRGDVVRALDHNLFLPIVLGLVLVGYVRWSLRSFGRPVTPVRTPGWLPWAVAGVVLTFWVVRNLGGSFAWLASAAS